MLYKIAVNMSDRYLPILLILEDCCFSEYLPVPAGALICRSIILSLKLTSVKNKQSSQTHKKELELQLIWAFYEILTFIFFHILTNSPYSHPNSNSKISDNWAWLWKHLVKRVLASFLWNGSGRFHYLDTFMIVF